MHRQIATHVLSHYKHIHRSFEWLDSAQKPWACVAGRTRPPKKNIVVFPGSFNPPTRAHLAMLRQAFKIEARSGEHWQVYAALSRQIIDKEAIERMTLLDRVFLLEEVMRRYGRSSGLLLLNRGLYVEQARGIRAAFPHINKLLFLMGFDKIVQILDPRYYDDRDIALAELFRLAQLLVAPRGDAGQRELQILLTKPENRPFARFIRLLPFPDTYRAMSSTEARADTHQQQNHLVSELPTLARDFIWRTQPYAEPVRQTDGTFIDIYAERTRQLQALLG